MSNKRIIPHRSPRTKNVYQHVTGYERGEEAETSASPLQWRVYGRPLTPPGQITRFSRYDFPAARPPNKKEHDVSPVGQGGGGLLAAG